MTQIDILDYPDASILNKILYPIIKDAEKYFVAPNTACRTTFNIHKSKEVSGFTSWLENKFPKYKIAVSWGMVYNIGEGANKHSHDPYPMTFVYYVNVPEGSSPLIVEDQTINIKEGQVIFFPGDVLHSVPRSTVDGRCIIAGQVTYKSIVPRIILFLKRRFYGVGFRGKN